MNIIKPKPEQIDKSAVFGHGQFFKTLEGKIGVLSRLELESGEVNSALIIITENDAHKTYGFIGEGVELTLENIEKASQKYLTPINVTITEN